MTQIDTSKAPLHGNGLMSEESDAHRLSNLMTPVLEVLHRDTKFEFLLLDQRLKNEEIMIVVDAAGKILGSIGCHEIMEAITGNSPNLKVGDIMIPVKESVPITASHHEARNALIRSNLRFLPVTDDGKPVGVLWATSLLIAMTQSYRLKQEELVRAQETDKSRDEFLGILLHDIRSPLAVISSCCDLLELNSPNLSATQIDFIETIKGNMARCLALSEDLLRYGKLNDGINLNPEIVEIHIVLDELVENLKIIGLQKYGVLLETDWCGPVGIQIDRIKFGQIIDNLVINAFKVTPRGKRVFLKTHLIDDFQRFNKALRVEVTDEGPGIPGEKVRAIFEKYSQLDNQQGAPGGVGLGLGIVAKFVRLHNGEIHVDEGGQDSGRGATFVLTFPNASILRVNSLRETIKGYLKILIVDDDEDIRDTLVAGFHGLPYDIRTAADGVQGFQLFSTWGPDLVVADMRMPGKNGLELFHEIRLLNPKIGLLLISGALEDYSTLKIDAAFSPDGYLSKPFSTKALTDLVAKILEKCAPI